MKKTIKFSKAFLPAWILSGVLIVVGLIGLFTKGINFGLDFRAGLIEEVKIAPTVLELSYAGSATVSVETSAAGMDIVITGAGAINRTESFMYAEYPTLGALSAGLNAVPELTAKLLASEGESSSGLFVNSAVSTVLTEKPFKVYGAVKDVGIDEVRAAVQTIDSSITVKEIGSAADRSFQIRMADSGEEGSNKKLSDTISNTLKAKFGEDCVAVVKTDFIGSQFSKSLTGQALILVAATLILIWAYATFRFHWDFALGSIVALVHDSLIMISFIVWTQLEFTTTTLAAILAIIGYSINATVVILDRVRTDMKLLDVRSFNGILDTALSETLGRSVITTVTTMFSAISLYIFVTGSIKDFALVLLVGLISGCYSSILISSGLISFIRRNWKPEAGIHHALHPQTDDSHVLKFDAGAQG